jgi:tetratricopeptide (TPR) repeat protein
MTHTFRFSVLTAALIAVAACQTQNKVMDEKGTAQVVVLSADDIFEGSKVQAFLANKPQEKNTGVARELFLKGIDAYKNKKNNGEAISAFTESILKQPSSMTYYELGNVLLDTKDYDKALKSYSMAEKLGYEPFSKILYNIACVHALMGEPELSGQYLEYALQAGYTNIDNIAKDPDLANLREDDYLFKMHLNRGLNGMSDAENLFWLQFRKPFAKTKLPLTLDLDKISIKFTDDFRISYDFEKFISEMRDEKFSREVSKGFYHVAQIVETKKYTALIYIVNDEFAGEEEEYDAEVKAGGLPAPQLMTFRLVTFTPQGKLIDKKQIAGRELYTDLLKVATISKDKVITIKSYEITHKEDPEDVGYVNNPIKSRELVETEEFNINDDGLILPMAASVEMPVTAAAGE